MSVLSPGPGRAARVLGGLVALALVIGMRFPAVPQVPDPTGKAEQTADPLLNLNNASQMFYTLAKQQTLAKSGPVMIVVGDDLVLRKGEKRTQAKVIPEIYHTLKTFDHIPLALDVALTAHAGETPLGEDFLNELRDYRGLFPAAGERIDRVGLDAEQRARQKMIIAACAQFVDSVLDKRQCLPVERMAFTRKMTPLLMANAAAAARAALDSLHHQVCEWKGQLTPQDWSDLTVLASARSCRARTTWPSSISRGCWDNPARGSGSSTPRALAMNPGRSTCWPPTKSILRSESTSSMTRTAWLATCGPTARAIICRYCSINLGKLALLARTGPMKRPMVVCLGLALLVAVAPGMTQFAGVWIGRQPG